MTYEKLKEVSEEKSLQKTKNKAGGAIVMYCKIIQKRRFVILQ